MCCWETNRSQRKDKNLTAAGQARLEGLCPPVPGRALAPRQETQTQTYRDRQTDRQTGRQADRQTDRQSHNTVRQTEPQHNDKRESSKVFICNPHEICTVNEHQTSFSLFGPRVISVHMHIPRDTQRTHTSTTPLKNSGFSRAPKLPRTPHLLSHVTQSGKSQP